MAFEQNPYAVKVTLVADSTLQPATTSPLPSTEKQFRFVKIAGSVAPTGTVVIGSPTITSVSAFSGVVPGSAISISGGGSTTNQYAAFTGYVVSVSIANSSITLNAPIAPAGSGANGGGGSATLTIASSSQQSGGPVASAITGTTGTATSTRLFGIIQNAPLYKNAASGTVEAFAEAEITVSGISKVQAGATIAAGDPITADGYGNAMTATFATTGTTNAPASTQYVYGTALTGGVVGDIIAVAISCASAVRAG